MPNKKQSNIAKKSRISRTKRTYKWNRILIWVVVAAAFVGIIAGTWWNIATRNDTTKLNADIMAPETSTFNNDVTMFFATPNSIPEPNNDRELSVPDNVVLSYGLESGQYAPAFKMDINGDDLSQYIEITPFIRGTWYMRGDNAVMFTPDDPWPADTKFTIKTKSGLFNPDVRVNTKRITFTTPQITASVDNFNLYPAPDNKKSVIGIAVISFNYAINTNDFADRVSLKLNGERLGFSVQFDRFHRTAFIISEPIPVTTEPQNMHLKLNRIPAAAGDADTKKINANVTIQSADNIFKIDSIQTNVVDMDDGNSQQLILINTTTAAQNNIDWSKYLTVYLLPKYRDADEQTNEQSHTWMRDEITDQVLSESTKLNIKQIDFATPNGVYQYAFTYNVSDDDNRNIYIDVQPGIMSANGFTMQNGWGGVLDVPYLQKTVGIAGSGALLSLSGDRKLGLVARGGADTAYVNLYKVKSSEINHLISQTYNVFAPNMEFKSWAFDAYDMSVVFQKKISFTPTSRTRANYASIDLGDYLDRTYGDNTGIFIIQTGTSENTAEYNDKRLILLTDMGIIRKVNQDSSSVVFVSNLSSGTPAADVEIYVLGRNGNAIWSGRTDDNGHVNIPALPWSEYRNAREPVAIVARRGNDIAFIPYNAYNQQVEYSKFDIDGVYAYSSSPMNAFMFSDRGIYRPGETLILAGIVKDKSFKPLAGIPVRLQIFDSRGRTILEKTFSLTADGMFDAQYEIPNDATLGNWNAYLYSLTSNNNLSDMLGTATFDVQEFVPDTLKISAHITNALENGWIATNNLHANVSLRNLFGTPATNRRISARATLHPVEYSFNKFNGYNFTTNFISGTGLSDNVSKRARTFSIDLPDVRTDENGNADFDINFENNIPYGTYMLTLNVRGFESNSGQSVQTNITTRVSDAKYLVGWRANDDLSYINRNALRKINLIAIDNTATQIATNDLTLRTIRREKQTTLVKDYNNFYKYQTVTRDNIIDQRQINISKTGTDITLDTTNGGTYIVQILDTSENILANIEYFVAGGTNTSLQTDTNAELRIKLNHSEYAPGDDIAINITAPYTGTGLITIERDKVYAYKWFKTTSTSSVQHITVPDGFAGTGYVNVSFVRDINSRDIFTTPYAYAVAPFSADVSAHEIKITLDVPETVRDNKLAIKYTSDKNAHMMIFAVDTGILQVAKYQIPNPIAHFFQKSALQVNTYQILSLLLPEYNILREYAKTGGGDYGGGMDGTDQILRNPFARDTLPPVAFYSKILNARANTPGIVEFEIPEHFNGEITIFAVAANTSAIGATDAKTLVQSPIIISTSAPLFAAPNDTFTINSVITNMTDTDSDNPTANINIETNDKLELIGTHNINTQIPQNTEKLITFDVRALNTPGNADIILNAELTDADKVLSTRHSNTTISVRPATTFTTYIKSDIIDSKRTRITDFKTDLYSEYATRKLYISRGADAFVMPLFKYLEKYEYPCTEQLVSRAMPFVVMPTSEILGTTFDNSLNMINETIGKLRNRQNVDGSFALWPGEMQYGNQNDVNAAYLTAYVTQFLTIAKNAGFDIPTDMLSRATDYLRTFAGNTITSDEYARTMAYAIYVISSNDYITTSYIDTLTQYANENIKNWQSDLMGTYIAASYKIMKQDDLARDLFAKYEISSDNEFESNGIFNSNVANDAMYYYIAAKHFTPQNPTESILLRKYIESGQYSAHASAAVIMALSGIPASAQIPDVRITANVQTTIDTSKDTSTITATIPNDASEITIECDTCDDTNMLFYTLLQQGFPTESDKYSNGIEIVREYYDSNDNRITSGNIGDIVTVKIFARTRGGVDVAQNVAITDLLPGGFIPNFESATGNMDYIEMREDRVLIYTDLTRDTSEFTYTAQIGTAGTFTIPGVRAESMYNPQIAATGDSGIFTVKNEVQQ